MLVDRGYLIWLSYLRLWLSFRMYLDAAKSRLCVNLCMVSIGIKLANMALKYYFEMLESSKRLVP